MARPLRVEYPGAIYHVINRGNAGESIFKLNSDRQKFLEYLQKAVERFLLKIHAFCLMDNHFHILLETQQPNLSRAVQWINVSYAIYFNRKYNRSGHLFHGRFKSILVDADEYLKELSRYIHLNPVRAGLVDQPADYEWSSYPMFIEKMSTPDWIETDWLLSQFGKRRKQAMKKYMDFVEKIDAKDLKNPAVDLTGGFILGSPGFVKWVKEAFLADRSDDKEIPQLRQLKPVINKEGVVDEVCKEFGCDKALILRKGRKKNLARDISIYLVREMTGEPGKSLGEYFGNISNAAITNRVKYLSRKCERDAKVRGKIKRLKNKIMYN
jgi:REP element-mobilizing transposase RayT